MKIIEFANAKGGCGKTTLAHHLAVRAKERKLRVHAIDTDRQGDFYRRLVGDSGNLFDMPPEEWAKGCHVIHTPEAWMAPRARSKFDLVVVDTPPSVCLVEGPPADWLLIPVDGVDAVRNAPETLAEAKDCGAKRVGICFVGLDAGGKRQAAYLAQLKRKLPKGVFCVDIQVPRGGSINRSARQCAPAWQDMWPGRDSVTIKRFCDSLLQLAGVAK